MADMVLREDQDGWRSMLGCNGKCSKLKSPAPICRIRWRPLPVKVNNTCFGLGERLHLNYKTAAHIRFFHPAISVVDTLYRDRFDLE